MKGRKGNVNKQELDKAIKKHWDEGFTLGMLYYIMNCSQKYINKLLNVKGDNSCLTKAKANGDE